MKEITPALLHHLYTQSDKSGLQVARQLGIGRTTLGRYLKKYNIPMKSMSKVMSGRKLSIEHREKVIKTLRNGSGKNNPAWKGGVTRSSQGYIWIKTPNHPLKNAQGYVAEHRLVMEAYLGRYLNRSESIHHMNEDKSDNRVENLKIVTTSEHSKIHFSNPEMKRRLSKRMEELYKDEKERKKQSERSKSSRRLKYWSTKKK